MTKHTQDAQHPALSSLTSNPASVEHKSATQGTTSVVDRIRDLAGPLKDLAAAADALPQEYRAVAFAEFTRFLLAGDSAFRGGAHSAPSLERSRAIDRSIEAGPKNQRATEFEGPTTPLQRVERALGLPADALRRVLQIDTDKTVQVLSRVEGRSISDRQIRLAQILCYVREKAFGEMKTDIETLRAACIAQGRYDSANFAANFRREGSVLEAPTPGSKDRLFILSRDGVESATALLRELAGN